MIRRPPRSTLFPYNDALPIWVLDLGCGEGRLLRRLLADPRFTEIVGMDVATRVLEQAESRLKLERLAPKQRQRIRLLHGSLMYRDVRLRGFEAAAVMEVIEHLDPPRLRAFERVLFESAHPGMVAVTTPNAEYNVKWPSLPAGKFRHPDHRFEWSRSEFQQWARGIGSRFGYGVRFVSVGDVDALFGPPTQMAIFTHESAPGKRTLELGVSAGNVDAKGADISTAIGRDVKPYENQT